jgi:hypothetical protein
MKHLYAFGRVKPLLHNGKLISISLFVDIKGHKNKTIIFKDSYLMLPQSLRQLCKSFKVEIHKGHFPFNMSNINYTGVFPQFDYWTDITALEYDTMKLEFKNKIWSFKDEAIKYCVLDCVSLHQGSPSTFLSLVF